MIYALGIDPGSVSGYALVSLPTPTGKPQLVAHGEARRVPYSATLDDLQARVGVMEQVHACVEHQFLPSDAGKGAAHRAHAVDALACAASRGSWVEACSRRGWPVSTVLPQVWRSDMLSPYWRPTSRSEECKDLAVRAFTGLFGIRLAKSHHHVAEAALIACWVGEVARQTANTRTT